MLGTIHCLVSNLHIGSLKKFGYPSAMLDGKGNNAPASLEVVSEDLLNDPQIKSALSAGVITFIPNSEDIEDQGDEDHSDLSFLDESEEEGDDNGSDEDNSLENFESKLNELEGPKKSKVKKSNSKKSGKNKKN